MARAYCKTQIWTYCLFLSPFSYSLWSTSNNKLFPRPAIAYKQAPKLKLFKMQMNYFYYIFKYFLYVFYLFILYIWDLAPKISWIIDTLFQRWILVGGYCIHSSTLHLHFTCSSKKTPSRGWREVMPWNCVNWRHYILKREKDYIYNIRERRKPYISP